MRKLVVCCDGTWDTKETRTDGVPTPTNVARLFNALAECDVEGNEQLRYYHPGVGADAGVLDKLLGGGLGLGLSRNIKNAYAWLAGHYQPGDDICLFGFSRGAYTVRSLAGMIATCGLLEFPAELSAAKRLAQVDSVYDDGYRPGRRRNRDWRASMAFHELDSLTFVGVWDTVGSLGVPDSFGLLNLFDVESKHNFHNTKLTPMIKHARHAVAMDERRAQFSPTLWLEPDLPPDSERTIKQVWFPGNHRDVGGGHAESGLSDAALGWMISESINCAGLAYRQNMLDQLRPNPQDVLHDDCVGVYRHLGSCPRAVPMVNPDLSAEIVHSSVFDRQANPPITVGPYRETVLLDPGQSRRVEVLADEPWNDTNIYLAPGRYTLAGEGEWMDRSVPAGPDGASDGAFYLDEFENLIGTFRGWFETQFKNITSNKSADFFGTKRVEGVPWMALIGMVADGAMDPETGVQLPYEPFLIGKGCEIEVRRGGYLYAFANDSWGFYDNNRGSVSLTVNRVE